MSDTYDLALQERDRLLSLPERTPEQCRQAARVTVLLAKMTGYNRSSAYLFGASVYAALTGMSEREFQQRLEAAGQLDMCFDMHMAKRHVLYGYPER